MVKIILDRDVCIGCGSCQAVCQKYWEMADDAKINLLGFTKKEGEKYELELDEAGCNQEAVEVCPVQCIHIEK